MNPMSEHNALISWCRTRISQLREQPETPSREARLDELSAMCCFVQGLEVLQKLRERDEPDYEGIAIEAARNQSTEYFRQPWRYD